MPTLVDNDFIIWESHAICAYLVDKYGKNDKLYPKHLRLRAKCNQRLFFNVGSLFPRLRDCTVPILFRGCTQEKVDAIDACYAILEVFLTTDPFLVGEQLTIADICIAGTVLPLGIYSPLKTDQHSHIFAWLNRINQTVPFFEKTHEKYLNELRLLIESTIEKNKQISKQ